MAPPHVLPRAGDPFGRETRHGDIERLGELADAWMGLDPTAIAERALETLLDLLSLDFVGLRFNDTTHVFLRLASEFETISTPEAIRAALRQGGGDAPSETTLVLSGAPVSVVRCELGLSSSLGEIVAGARRASFPNRTERSILKITAAQTSLACREVREASDRRPPEDPRERPISAAALAESEWRLHLTINTIPAMAWSTTADGLIDFCNQNFVDFVGWTPEKISGQGFWPIFHPDDIDHLLASWQEIMATKRPRDVEGRIRRADGNYRWFVLRQNPLFDAEGNVIKWYGVGTDIEDRKRAEAAVRDSERNLSLILDSLPVLVWSARPDGSADYVNQRFVDYIGLPAASVLEFGFTKLFHPDDVERMMADWNQNLAGDASVMQGRIRRFDGAYRWFLFSGQKLTDASGAVRWFGVNVDIENLRQAEDALRASEAALRDNERALSLMLDAIPCMAWSATAWGHVDTVNKQFGDFVGMTTEALLEAGFHTRFHPDDVDRMFDEWRAMMAAKTGGDIEGRSRRADGEYRWLMCRCSPVLDADGEIVRWYGVNIDIEDKKFAQDALRGSEAALRDSERRLQQIVSSIPGLTWSSDPDGATTFWSPQYLDYAGAKQEDVLGFGFTNYIHPDDRDAIMRQWGEMIAAGSPGEAELRLRGAHGDYRWFLIRASPFFDENGNLTQWFGVNVDIENRKHAEEELRQSQNDLAHVTRMTTMGELAVSIAHEVNQPLMAIVTNAGACLRWLDGPQMDIAMARQAVERIVRDGHRAGDIITSLRNLARKSAPRLEQVRLEQVIQVVFDILQGELQRSGVVAKVQLEKGPITIMGDITQLQQVVLNLIMNAIEAMKTTDASARGLSLRAEVKGGHALVSVTDTGPGLGSDDPERLFEAFFSTKDEGIGMGLSICRSIIEAHGGRIWASNSETPGSVFSFTLPLAEG